MSDFPHVARAGLVVSLALALMYALLPAVVLAQEPVALSGAFEVQGDSAAEGVAYTWTVTEPDLRWRLEPPGRARSSASRSTSRAPTVPSRSVRMAVDMRASRTWR